MKKRRDARNVALLFETRLANLEEQVRALRLTIRGYGVRIKTLEERETDGDP